MRVKDLAQFSDIKAVLDTVIREDKYPVLYTQQTMGEAINWRTRCHTYRKAIQYNEEQRLNLIKGEGTSLYDKLILRIDKINSPTTVSIDLRKPLGLLEIDGKPVSPTADEDITLGLNTKD